jgi:membrane fusion protein (multidrug efflux system)
MKLKSVLIVIAVIAIFLAIKFIFLQPEAGNAPKPGMASGPVNVTGFIIKPKTLDNKIYSSGTLVANEEVELHPEVSGKLIYLLNKEGIFVTKGTLLAKVNDAELQAQFKKLELQQKLAEEKEKRLKGLLEINGISQEEYDIAVHNRLSIAADKEFIQAQIAKTEVRAPFSGKLGLKQVSEGGFVSSSTILGTIQQTNPLKIDFSIPEKYAPVISVGDSVIFRIENNPNAFVGKVSAIEPRIDPSTRNLTVRAIYANTVSNLIPGAFAKIEVISSRKQAAIMIPTEAIIPELKSKKVFISKDGKAFPVKVETGVRNDAYVEVLSGLSPGDTVIQTGIMSVKPESPLKFMKITE